MPLHDGEEWRGRPRHHLQDAQAPVLRQARHRQDGPPVNKPIICSEILFSFGLIGLFQRIIVFVISSLLAALLRRVCMGGPGRQGMGFEGEGKGYTYSQIRFIDLALHLHLTSFNIGWRRLWLI